MWRRSALIGWSCRPFAPVPVSIRQFIALGSLVNALVALYLHLWKLGLMGSLACSSGGGCAYVQGSPWSWFLGVDVALIGAVGYSVLFVVAIVGSLPRFEDTPWVTRVMQGLIWAAVLFTLRLKYGEFIVLKSFCSWCAISAVSITVFAVLVTLDARRVLRANSPHLT
ncbi:MAG: hypothetical protein C0516_01850 [Gemmatimonas sp.]|nr:hypothetical protein [Gemmatimonas sp.]